MQIKTFLQSELTEELNTIQEEDGRERERERERLDMIYFIVKRLHY